MENLKLLVQKYLNLFSLLSLLFCLVGLPSILQAQQSPQSYELVPAPDLWYNDVDGIRVGVRVIGQVPGTYGDGPHRLEAGVWLGTWIPDYPVSYYISFTEPIESLSDFGSEGSVEAVSSIRTGLQRHGIAFNKRWQTGFDENNYKELRLGLFSQRRFEEEYVQFPQLWQDKWLYLLEADFLVQDEFSAGRYMFRTTHSANVLGNAPFFINSNIEFQQFIPLGKRFEVRTRLFGGLSTNESTPEYLFSHSFQSAVGWMDKGMTRAKGTIPSPWMNSGIIQVAGGPNLRGYLGQDIEDLNEGFIPLFTSMGAVNLELDFPTPLSKVIKDIPFLGELTDFRSYLFFDTGTSLGITQLEEDKLLSDAGLGFLLSINIPDYLGKQRGLVIRYDVPLWLSNPKGENRIEFRNLIGIGAVISL